MTSSDREYFIDDLLELRGELKRLEEPAQSAHAYDEWLDTVAALEDLLEAVRHG